MKITQARELASKCAFDASSIQSVETIISLWGGMGHVYRVRLLVDGRTTVFIVKLVDARRANPSNRGDKRKLDSYVVERNFYAYCSKGLLDKGVKIPRFLHAEEEGHRSILCLSELYNVPSNNRQLHQGVLDWLARFHAATWQKGARCSDQNEVQSCGTYWHLDTRPDEWYRMSERGWEGRLKRAARPIDKFLKDETSIQSWVHGDAKDANVMWDGDGVAMCDFQYVGVGCPMKDVCYFLCSSCVSLDESHGLIDFYFKQLNTHLTAMDKAALSRTEFDFVLGLCYCDYMRFMCGWGQWGSDITGQVVETLGAIDGGRLLESESSYQEAIQRAFDATVTYCNRV